MEIKKENIAAKDIPEETLTKIFYSDPLPETAQKTIKNHENEKRPLWESRPHCGHMLHQHEKTAQKTQTNNPSDINSKKQKVPTKNKPSHKPTKIAHKTGKGLRGLPRIPDLPRARGPERYKDEPRRYMSVVLL